MQRNLSKIADLKNSNPVTQTKRVLLHSVSGLIQEKQVDLKAFPRSHGITLTNTDHLVLGDLHGNALKLLWFLIHENIITGINDDDYFVFAGIYCMQNHKLEKFHITIIKEIVAKIKLVHPANSSPLITLIGDVLADRGSNDYFTLKVLEKLKQLGLNITILISNHDREFIGVYEGSKELASLYHDEFQTWISICNLSDLIDKKFIDLEDVQNCFLNYYLPMITAMDYSINEQKKEIIFYSHAPIPLTKISEMGLQLGVSDGKSDITQQTNIALQIDLINKKIAELCNKKILFKSSPPGTALSDLMWLRQELEKNDTRLKDKIVNGWTLTYVHGHDARGRTWNVGPNKSVVNLDNKFGQAHLLTGEYTAYYAGHNPNFLELRKKTFEVSASTNPVQFFSAAKNDIKTDKKILPKIKTASASNPNPTNL